MDRERVLVLMLVVALLLVACKSDGEKTPQADVAPPTPPAEVERTTILFAVYDWVQPAYEDLIETFEAANPDLHVQLVSIEEVLGLDPMGGDWPDDAWQRLASAADVLDMQAYPQVTRQGLVRDLSPLIEADPTFEPEDFLDGMLQERQWDGGTWSLPTTVSFELIFYDKDAFDEAGVAYPEPGWTWDDFVAKARALTVREGNEVTRWGFVQPWPDHLRFVQCRVGPLVDETTDLPVPRFDQPEVIEAVRWYTDLYLEEQLMPHLERPQPDESGRVTMVAGQQLVDEGKAAMWRESSSNWEWRKQQGNLGVVPYPVDVSDSRTSFFWTQGLSMSAGTAHPEAAWRWMTFLSRQGDQDSGPYAQQLPARRSVAEASGFWDEMDEELAAALRFAIDHSYTWSFTVGYGLLNEAVEAVLKGEKSVQDALSEAQVRAQGNIQEYLAQQTEATPVPTPFVVASPEEDQAVAEGAASITFVPGGGSFDKQRYRDAAQQFHEQHPDIFVEVKMPDYRGDRVDMQSFAGQSDCFQWFSGFQDPEQRAAILSLQPFLDADPAFSTDDFYPSALKEFTWQGQLWGLPAEVYLSVIEYNKDLFDAAGVAYPAPGWTTDDFLDAAVALTQGEGEGKQYGFVSEVYEAGDMLIMLGRLGAKLFDEHADPPAATFDDPATVEALRWYTNLSTLYAVKPIFMTDYGQMEGTSFYMEREALIDSGRAAMWTRSSNEPDMGERSGLNVGVAPLPVGDKAGSSMTWSAGYFISAQAGNPQACWEWIKFLTEQTEVAQGLPARRSVAESDAYRQQVGAERATAYLASVAEADLPSLYSWFTEKAAWLGGTTVWLSQAYGRVLEGDASVEEALAAAQKLADDFRACIITRDAFSDQEEWQACMKETDPSLPDFMFGSEEEE
jgi:multiple sugar transport system substrate-binding protein